jgi:predicted nucleic acid-binding protein
VGSLKLPTSGLVYFDSQAVIYSVETHAEYWSLLEPVWQAAEAGAVEIVSSDLLLLEALVGPLRSGDQELVTAYEQLVKSPEMRLLPITEAVLRKAARLRADLPALRTPDAIHGATALLASCDLFVTNDFGFRQVPGLPLVVLRDHLRRGA